MNNNCKHTILLLLGVLLLISPVISAKPEYKRIIWSKKQHRQTGLYTMKSFFVSHGVSLTAAGMYYYGDVDNEGVAFKGGFNLKNLSYGGGFTFAYNMPAGNHCNMRFGITGGTLRGDNKLKFSSLADPRDDFRKFNSILIQPSVGVEYYPFVKSGFFLYGGVGVSVSIITNYEFWYYKNVGSNKVRTLLQGKTFGILPMVQLGIGYSWLLTPSWSISAEIMIQEGLIDTHYMNLDAFPLAPSQNSDKVALGNSFGTYTDRYGKEQIHWNDGWFQVGITVTYRWRNCEECRIINNYTNIRPSRR